ncbi:MAG: histidine kinase [Flavobacteriales bacterium]|nr:histidine kinase [Flavobacteriales bacterium]
MRVRATMFVLIASMRILHAQDDPLKDVQGAVEALGRASTAERFQAICDLAKAYRAAGQLDSAVAVGQRALALATTDKDRLLAHSQLARTLRDGNNAESTQHHARESILLARALADTFLWIRSEHLLGRLAFQMSRFDVARKHQEVQYELATASRDTAALVILYNDIGNAHYLEHHYDSARWYYSRTIELIHRDDPQRVGIRMNMANILIEEGKYDQALQELALAGAEIPSTQLRLRSVYHNTLGFALYTMERYRDAVKEFQRSDSLNQAGLKDLGLSVENMGFMADSYIGMGDTAHAYLAMGQLEVLKDSFNTVANDEHMLALEKKFETRLSQEEIQRLDAENRQQEQRLRLRNLQLYGSLALAVLALGGGLLVLRNLRQKRKHSAVLERLNTQLQDKQVRIEEINALLRMKVLRTQMDPHFIHNCLNAIRALSLKGDHERADEYLEGFARLLRTVLEHSVRDRITLEEEIAFLKDYVKLEQLRLGDDFTWSITADQTLIDEEPQIPSLLVQPFVENAIWHGLAPKQGPKRLDIHFTLHNGTVTCCVEDNGVGRSPKAPTPGRTSLGLKLTGERLELLTERMKSEGGFRVEDLKDDEGGARGTRVVMGLQA